MPLESGTTIDILNSSNPAATDGLSQADDHLRLIKGVIKATFPNWTGVLTASHTQVDAVVATLLTGPVKAPAAGAVATPAFTMATDLDTGLYFAGANNPAISAGGVKIQDWTTTGASITGTLAVSGAVAVAGVLTAGGIWRTGDVKLTMQPTAEAGWLVINDQTIGNVSSGATFADASTLDLYSLIWNNVSDTYAPVTGGRSLTAVGDWTSQKKMGLTKMLGRALAIAGAGSGLTSRAVGEILGTETHTLTQAQLPTTIGKSSETGIPYDMIGPNNVNGGGSVATPFWAASNSLATTGVNIVNAGGGNSHPNMQPTSFLRAHIKL